MVEISIPGHTDLTLTDVVLDYNGTLALDGQPLDGVLAALAGLAHHLQLHIVTADTFGKARLAIEPVPCRLSTLAEADQAEAKQAYVRSLGSERTAAIGNGRNDRLMLREAVLGIAVIGEEGAAAESVLAADIVCCDVLQALGLLLNPKRLVATLRS